MATAHDLTCVCLENVNGTTQNIGGGEAVYPRLLNTFQDLIPHFSWGINSFNALDYYSPASRQRVLLRGLSKIYAEEKVPAPLKPFGKVALKDMLGDCPNTPLSQLTPTRQQDLKDIDKNVRIKMLAGKLKASSLLVVATDRATNKAYQQQLVVDHAPCLTCHNKVLVDNESWRCEQTGHRPQSLPLSGAWREAALAGPRSSNCQCSWG